MPADPTVVAASIAAIPATVAAGAALVQAMKTDRKISTNGSGKPLGLLVEYIAGEVGELRETVDEHGEAIARIEKKVNQDVE